MQMDPNTPLSPPPPGKQSNFDDPESNAYQLFIVQGVTWAIVIPVFVVRCYTRLCVTKNWGVDDYLITIGFLLTTALCCLGIEQSTKYYGKHAWDVRVIDTIKGKLALETVIGLNLLVVSSFFIRMSICFLYRRLFSSLDGVRTWIYVGMAWITAYSLAVWIAFLVTGVPSVAPDGGPDLAHYPKFLATARVVSYLQSAANIVTDILLMAIPLKPVMKLSMSPQKKVAVSLIFLTGILGTVAAIIGVGFRSTFENQDPTWYNTGSTICWFVELNVGIIVACAPMLAKFSRSVYKKHYRHDETAPEDRDIADATWGNNFWNWFAGNKLCSGEASGRLSNEHPVVPSAGDHSSTFGTTAVPGGTGDTEILQQRPHPPPRSDSSNSHRSSDGKSDKGSSGDEVPRGDARA